MTSSGQTKMFRRPCLASALLLALALGVANVHAKAVPYGSNSADTQHVRLQGMDEARARLEAEDQRKFQVLKNWTVENGGWVSNKLGTHTLFELPLLLLSHTRRRLLGTQVC